VADSQTSETIDALKNILPLGIFNHTYLVPLSDNPITISIETKTGTGWESAKLQMEVWTAAHWQFLRQLLSLRQRAQKVITPNDRDTHETINEKATGKIWSLPKFIPGIVVQGHDWHLIITTPGGGKTVSW
jgi:hypothetical protein